MLRVNCNHLLFSCLSLVNCLWISNLFKYMNICISLTHFLLDTHTHSVSQPTPGTDKGSFMFAGLSWGQWVLMLRASFTRSEWSWRRNERKPYISRCCRVKEILLVYNSFLDSFLPYYRDNPPWRCTLPIYCTVVFWARRIIVCLVPFELSTVWHVDKSCSFLSSCCFNLFFRH